MKKYLLLIPVVLLITIFALPKHHSVIVSPHKSTTQIRTETPTEPTVQEAASNTSTDTITQENQQPVILPLVDMDSQNYLGSTVVSKTFKSVNTWVLNVSYTCTEPSPNLVVAVMELLPPSQAQIRHYVLTSDGAGSYSVIENQTSPVYIRISGNCAWHISAVDNGTASYQPVIPCTLTQSYSTNKVNNPPSCGG